MKTLVTIATALLFLSSPPAMAKEKSQTVTVSVTENGFEPSSLDVKPGIPVVLKVTRKTDATCATEIKVPSKKIKKALPLNKEVALNLGKLEKGEIKFTCGMDMVSGNIHVE